MRTTKYNMAWLSRWSWLSSILQQYQVALELSFILVCSLTLVYKVLTGEGYGSIPSPIGHSFTDIVPKIFVIQVQGIYRFISTSLIPLVTKLHLGLLLVYLKYRGYFYPDHILRILLIFNLDFILAVLDISLFFYYCY